MITYGVKEKDEAWKKNFEIKHTSMVLNMAVLDLFKDKAKEQRLSLSVKKPSRWDFAKARSESSESELSLNKKPDLQGVYEMKYSLVDKSSSGFIYRKEKKQRRKPQENQPGEPSWGAEPPKSRPKQVPVFSKMKSRQALVDAKEYRLIDMDELEDQRITRAIQSDPQNHWTLQDSSRP